MVKLLLFNMENKTSWLPYIICENDSSHLFNHTEARNVIYVFTPADDIAKPVLCLVLLTIGAMGFLSNSLLFYFLWQKPAPTPFLFSRFARNLNLYIRSLSLSDILNCALSLPLSCIQISFDVFQSGWACKIVRYANFIFPVITINNLVVISLEKYLSTRTVPRTFQVSTVRRMIMCAWVLGLLVMIFPVAAYDGIRVDLNETHYTIVYTGDQNFYPFTISLIIFPLQFFLPTLFVTCINICLLRTVWARERRRIRNGATNRFKANLRAKRIRGTTLLVALTFGFVIPFFFFIANLVYTQIAKPQREFATEYLMRYGTGSFAYLSALINFIIYFAQMKDFRVFLKKFLCKKNNDIRQPAVVTGGRRAYCLAVDRENVVEDNAMELTQLKTFNTTKPR